MSSSLTPAFHPHSEGLQACLVEADQPLQKVLPQLSQTTIGCLLVLQQGQIVGVLTVQEGIKALAMGKNPPVGQLMQPLPGELNSTPTSSATPPTLEETSSLQLTQVLQDLQQSLDLRDQELTQERSQRQQLAASLAQTQVLNRMIQNIHNSLDLETVFETAGEECLHLLRAERAGIFQAIEETSHPAHHDPAHPDNAKRWILRSQEGLPSNHAPIQLLNRAIPERAYPYAEDLRQIQTCQVSDAALAQQVWTRYWAKQFPGTWLLVPLTLGGQFWGSLVMSRPSPLPWQEAEIQLAEALANQLAIAIQQAELHRQVRRLNQDLERQSLVQTAQLKLADQFDLALKGITDKVRDSLDESQILQRAVQSLTEVLGVGGCNAALFDAKNQISTVCYEYTVTVPSYLGRTAQMDRYPEFYGRLMEGNCLQFCSLHPDPERGAVALLACPMRDDQGVLGSLWLVHQSYYSFREQDIRLIEQVANQCAIALRQSRLFQEAQAQVQELERLNQLKDDFLSTVSHELRTPMASIKMAIQMLEINLRRLEVLTPMPELAAVGAAVGAALDLPDAARIAAPPRAAAASVERYFSILKQECDREIGLITDLLDLTRLDAGDEPLVPSKVNWSEWLPQMLAPYRLRAERQSLHLTVSYPEHLPTMITHRTYLDNIVGELLENACKYTPRGERLDIVVQSETRGLHLQVKNSGVEIPPCEHERIFESFYRVPNHDPWKYGGTGLGLALVKKQVERLQGRIRVESKSGQTAFVLWLPWNFALPSL
jgi:signal transduction histidine kinase